MALKFDWNKEQIMNEADAVHAFALLREQQPKYCAFDTETTGLHITKDVPFFFQFGWLNTEQRTEQPQAYSFGVDLEKQPALARRVIRSWHNYLKARVEAGEELWYIGHNIKYDMHQIANIDLLFEECIPITENQFWIRYAHDAIHIGEGGPPLGLKEYATKYLDRNAKEHDASLQKERGQIAAKMNADLKDRITKAKCEVPEHLQSKFKSVTLSCLVEMFKDPIFDTDMLPEDIRAVYLEWRESLPHWIQKRVIGLVDPEHVPYNQLNRVLLARYALDDIVWTLEAFWQCKPVAERRENTEAIYNIENPSLWPIWHMERTGFKVNLQYLEESRIRLRSFILKRRTDLYNLTQTVFKIGQHELIKDLLASDFDLELKSTAAAEVDLVLSRLERDGSNPEAVACIRLIQELRTLEKWYSVYIMRFKTELDFYGTDRIWTQFNSVGAVSGRFTSNMQQMPKEGLSVFNGEELFDDKRHKPVDGDTVEEIFNPRKMVIVPTDEGFAGMSIIDYAGEELRFQAMYTILCGDPDLNLCRAYMPYKCHRKEKPQMDAISDRVEHFDYNNKQHLKEWHSEDWFLDESPEVLWTPTDIHSEMTVNCGFEKTDPKFKYYRSTVGKRLVFSKQYGAGLQKIIGMFPDFSPAKCQQLNDAYYNTFPGVKTYHKYCEYICSTQDYAINLFGTKYYNISAHKCKNMLVQGSCASFMKIKLRELYNYIRENKLRSVLLASIHDEVDFYIWPGEEHHIEEFSRIMTDWGDALIPIVAEPDYGVTNWAEIKDCSYYNWKAKQVPV